MRILNEEEVRQIEGGLRTKCPVCGRSVTVSWFYILFFGRSAAIRISKEQASSRHIRCGNFSAAHY